MSFEHGYEHSVKHVGPRGWLPYAAAGLVALALFIGVAGYYRKERLEAATPVAASVAAITANPDDYYGRAATINGRVVRVLDSQHYTVTDTGGELLVRNPRGIPAVPSRTHYAVLAPGDGIRVIGEVKKYELPRNAKVISPEVAGLTGRPVLFVDEDVVTAPATIASNIRPPAQHLAAIEQPRVFITDLNKIADARDRAALMGQRVQVRTVTVERVISDRGFWVVLPRGGRLFCRLHVGLDAGDMEWMVQVKERQIATLNGTLSEPPSASYMDRYWDLTSAEAAEVAGHQIYLRVDGITLRR